MLIFGIALLLTVAGIAGFPCWRHSRHFGYGPSLSAGVLLVLIALLAIGHRPDAPAISGPTTAQEAKGIKIATVPALAHDNGAEPARGTFALHRAVLESPD